MRLKLLALLSSALSPLFAAGIADAAPVSIAAGQTYTLSGDLQLTGADTLDASGTVENPCTIVGNGHTIVAQGLTGHIKVENCIFQGLGADMETSPALSLTAQGSADITIEGSTFDACGSIQLHMNGSSTATFNHNLLQDNGIAYIEPELGAGSHYVPAFFADGSSAATKVFQGNGVYRSAAHFEGVQNWLIGGYGDEFSNIFIGHRGVIRVRGNHVKVVGNYVNPQYPLGSPDVENVVVGSGDDDPDLVVEHNVLRSGEWVLRECQGEVRYNLIAEMNGHAWIKGPHDCNVHHNIFVNYATPDKNREAGIDAVYFTPHLNIYNNTFDGGGKLADLGVPALHASKGSLLERVHSNAFTFFTIPASFCTMSSSCNPSPAAAVSNVDPGSQYDDGQGTARMHYADYNLFYNPDADTQLDYSIPVVQAADDTTPIAKGEDGFGKHDVHAAPAYTGPFPQAFPYANPDIQAREATASVSTILKHYRDLYAPASGSPLVGAGDPHNGSHDPNPNNNIGAIGQGPEQDPDDQFGSFMPGSPGGPGPLGGSSSGGAAGGGTGNDGSPGGSTSASGATASSGGMLGSSGTAMSSSGATNGLGASAGMSQGSANGSCACELAASSTNRPLWGLAWLLAALVGAQRRAIRKDKRHLRS